MNDVRQGNDPVDQLDLEAADDSPEVTNEPWFGSLVGRPPYWQYDSPELPETD